MSAKTPSRSFSFQPSMADMQAFLESFLDQVLNQVFLMTRRGGAVRFTFFILGGLAAWIFFDVTTHPLVYMAVFKSAIGETLTFFLYPDPINKLVTSFLGIFVYGFYALMELFFNLFQADVLRHVLAISIPVFMAIRIATACLADIFELDDESIASVFITGSSFSTTYHRLTIENSDVAPKDLESPLLRVGGPGLIQVNLENVAVFERIDGKPHLIGPTTHLPGNVETIQSFERLREVIDLREQANQARGLSVKGRTRDGIPVTVQNVRYRFNVLRDVNAKPSEFSFTPDGIQQLVFSRGRSNRRKVNGNGGAEKMSFRSDWAESMKGLISRELRDFISSHTLNEFLALAEVNGDATAGLNFIPRPQIRQLFWSPEFKQRAANQGLQLNWIDIGSWDIPNKFVIDEHYEALKISNENEERRSQLNLVEEDSRSKELIRLIQEFQLVVYQAQKQDKPDEQIRTDLISDYLAVLRTVRDNYNDGDAINLSELDAAINYLSGFLKENLQRTGRAVFINPPEDDARMN